MVASVARRRAGLFRPVILPFVAIFPRALPTPPRAGLRGRRQPQLRNEEIPRMMAPELQNEGYSLPTGPLN